MEPKKPEKGSLVSSFRKAVLVVVAGVALAAGASNEANAQTTVTYGNQGVTATQGYQQQKPWASDRAYQERIRILAEQQELKMIQAQEKARADMARLQQQRTQKLAQHTQKLNALRKKSGTNALDYANLAAQWNAQEQSLRARATQIQATVERLQISQEQQMNKLVETLDKQYSRQEPYKSMLQNGTTSRATNAVTPVSTRPAAAAADPDQKMQDDMEKARRDAMQKLYKQYLNEEVKAGRIPDSAEDFFKKREAEQRQQQTQSAPKPRT